MPKKKSSSTPAPTAKKQKVVSKGGASSSNGNSNHGAKVLPYGVLREAGEHDGGLGLQDLEYGPAPESPDVAYAWLDDHGRKFGHFVNNKWHTPKGDRNYYTTKAPATGEELAQTIQGNQEDVDMAVAAAKEAQVSWAALPPHARARHLYSLARHVQKHARLIAVVEALDIGKTIRETRDADVPIVARWLYHYAGWAQLAPKEMQGWQPVGVIGGIVP